MTKSDRLHRMSRVAARKGGGRPTGRIFRENAPKDRARGADILREAETHWLNMDRFRRDRLRNKKYAFGDQWCDTIDVDGERMTEEQYIIGQGNFPLVNNHIHRLLKQFLGVYRSQAKEPTCVARDRDEQSLGETMSVALQYLMQLNDLNELNARTMEDFLIGGLAVQKKWHGWRDGRKDCWTDYVNPNSFFLDTNVRDFRGWDISIIGEFHDMRINSLVSALARSKAEGDRIRAIYAVPASAEAWTGGADFGRDRYENSDFLVPQDPTLCRVIEVWRKETRERYRCHDWNSGEIYRVEPADKPFIVDAENADRLRRGREIGIPDDEIPLIEAQWFVDEVWRFHYLTPWGDILREGDTPYAHGQHPYVFKAYPFIDGEIHSFVSDIIDQQRYTNRLITMYDWIMRASAKGLLMFPEDSLPRGMSMEDIASEWGRFNGVMVYRPKPGVPAPQQIASNCTNIGIHELLNLQLRFFEEISGINGALQGKPGYAGTSAALYNQQTQNATLSLLDILESFSCFTRDGAMKDVKNMQQYYDTPRMINIVGRNAYVRYDPEKVRDVEFDLSIVESTSTPAYRAIANDFLIQLWQNQAISVEQLLECGDFPFSDRLLQSIRTRQQQEAPQPPEGGASDAPAPLGGNFGLKVAP